LFGLFYIILVTDSKDHVDTASSFHGIVHNVAVGDACVWDDNGFVIGCSQGGGENLNRFDGSVNTGRLYIVPHFERFEDEHQEPSGKVGQAAL